MELSGQIIKGTGSYEVKEIAPPSEGGDLITNGGFDTDTDWTKEIGWTISGGMAHQDGTGSGSSGDLRQVALTVGKMYRLKFEVVSAMGGYFIIIGDITQFNSVGVHELIFTATTTELFFRSYSFVGSIDNVSAEEVPEGYPLLDKGTKYLECASNGTVAIPSDVAYGEWEFDVYKEADGNAIYNAFVSNTKDATYQAFEGYRWYIATNERFDLQRMSIGSNSVIFGTDTLYIDLATWYRIKITRTLDGKFYLYIKGGDYGTSDWVLMSVNNGANPVTDNTHTTSQYFVLDLDAGDRIANLEIRNLVRQ